MDTYTGAGQEGCRCGTDCEDASDEELYLYNTRLCEAARENVLIFALTGTKTARISQSSSELSASIDAAAATAAASAPSMSGSSLPRGLSRNVPRDGASSA